MTQNDAPETLLPCPFFGGEARVKRWGTRRMSHIVECDICMCNIETGETSKQVKPATIEERLGTPAPTWCNPR